MSKYKNFWILVKAIASHKPYAFDTHAMMEHEIGKMQKSNYREKSFQTYNVIEVAALERAVELLKELFSKNKEIFELLSDDAQLRYEFSLDYKIEDFLKELGHE